MNYIEIGKTIKKSLIDIDRSQAELSEECGLDRVTVSKACNGKKVSLESLKKIGDVLGVNLIK